MILARSGGCQQLDNLLDGFVGAVVCGFELALWAVFWVWLVVEAAVGEWSAQTFVEKWKQQRDLDTFWGETVGVAGSVTLDQSVSLELAQIIAELIEAVRLFGEMEGGEDGLVDTWRSSRRGDGSTTGP